MNSHFLLLAGLLTFTPALAHATSILATESNPTLILGPGINAASFAAYPAGTEFATLEPVGMPETTARSSAVDGDAPLSRAAWLLGPSLLAMATVARRRRIDIKPE